MVAQDRNPPLSRTRRVLAGLSRTVSGRRHRRRLIRRAVDAVKLGGAVVALVSGSTRGGGDTDAATTAAAVSVAITAVAACGIAAGN